MNAKSARSLMWLSIILLVAGSAVGTPAGTVLFMVLAALCAAAPIVVGPKGPRIVGIVVLAASIAVSVAHLAAARRHMDTYREKTMKPNTFVPPVPAQDK